MDIQDLTGDATHGSIPMYRYNGTSNIFWTNEHKEVIELLRKHASDKKMFFALMEDFFTPAELDGLALRWQIVKELKKGTPQREIAETLKVSISKITRGSRELADPDGGFAKLQL